MRYTQKDMRERLGFTRDQLRLYEKRGIIQPEIDPCNGYRYYDDWQVNLLWDCRYYQGMGFSLAEIEQIMRHDSLPGLEGRLTTHERDLEHELRYRELVLGECRQNLRMMREVRGLLGVYRRQRHEGCVFVPMRRNHELLQESSSEAVEFSARHAGLMAPYFWFPEVGGDTYYWGFAMRTTAYRKLGRCVSPAEEHNAVAPPVESPAESAEGTVRIDPATTLVTCVDAGERWNFCRKLFEGLFAEAARQGLKPVGGVHGLLIARTHDDAGYHRYVRAYLPLAG